MGIKTLIHIFVHQKTNFVITDYCLYSMHKTRDMRGTGAREYANM